MKIVSLSIQIATLILISCISVFAGQQDQSWEYKAWRVDSNKDFVRYITHAQVVHGHELGIVKKKGNCNQNLLYISWSTSDKRLAEHKGKDAVFRFQIDGTFRRQATIPLLSAIEPYPGRIIGVFTNFAVGEEFMSLLKKGHKLEVTIHGPDELVNTLDMTSDTFSLEGFTATMLRAQKFCEATVKQRRTIANPTLATELASWQNTISNHKDETLIVAVFFIIGFMIILFVKSMAEGRQEVEAYRVVNQESDEQQATIDFKHSDKEKALIEILVSTLSIQQSLFSDHAGLISQRVKDNWSMGYVYGYSDAFLQHNGYTGTSAEVKRLQLLITTLDAIFDGQGKEHLQRIAKLQKINDIQYTEGLSKGSTEMIDWLQDDKNIPLGWAIYVEEIPPEDMEKPKVIPLQANTESTQDGIKDALEICQKYHKEGGLGQELSPEEFDFLVNSPIFKNTKKRYKSHGLSNWGGLACVSAHMINTALKFMKEGNLKRQESFEFMNKMACIAIRLGRSIPELKLTQADMGPILNGAELATEWIEATETEEDKYLFDAISRIK